MSKIAPLDCNVDPMPETTTISPDEFLSIYSDIGDAVYS